MERTPCIKNNLHLHSHAADHSSARCPGHRQSLPAGHAGQYCSILGIVCTPQASLTKAASHLGYGPDLPLFIACHDLYLPIIASQSLARGPEV